MNQKMLDFKVKKFSSKYYSKPFPDAKHFRKIFQEIAPFNPLNVIDLGCSNGFFSTTFPSADYTGIELSDKRIKQCEEKGLKVIKADLEKKLPFKDNTFDCAISVNTLEHLYDTTGHLKEIRRILTNLGFLLFATPNISSFASRMYVLKGKRPPYIDCMREYDYNEDHISAFAYEDLVKMFKIAKLNIIKFRGFDNGKYMKVLNYFTDIGLLTKLSTSFIIVASKGKIKEEYPVIPNISEVNMVDIHQIK